jgi:hypothetical protein
VIVSHGEGFDWVHDDAVVLREQPAVAVYTNSHNEVVIRQACAWDEDDDTVIVVLPENARAVADAILAAAAHLLRSTTPHPSQPLSGAERQRRYRERNGGRDVTGDGGDEARHSGVTPHLPLLLDSDASAVTGGR